MEEDFGVTIELICLIFNIITKVCTILDNFLSFLKEFDERKTQYVSCNVGPKI
jgi:hypothetical protein